MLTSISENIEFKQTTKLLADRLLAYKNSGAVVVSVPKGGTPIAQGVSQILNLPLELMLCKRISHPGVWGESIGSVSVDEVVLSETAQGVPQDYIYHQIMLIKNSLKRQYRFFCGDHKPLPLKDKVVILVDDFLDSGYTLLACLRNIQKQGAKKVVVALALSSYMSTSHILSLTDEIIVLNRIDDPVAFEEAKKNLPRVTAEEVRDLFAKVYAKDQQNKAIVALNDQL